jgi:hypothetical protein
MIIDRRQFVSTLPAVGAFGVGAGASPVQSLDWPPMPQPRDAVTDAFPTHEPALVKQFVGLAHSNLTEVRSLLDAYPALAKAAWDWGFGDWETALGAAAHTGQRAIAELLLERGAPPTIFSAAMLGQLEVVKAFSAAGVPVGSLHGPHGIPLIAHARAGGPAAAAVVSHLESAGAASTSDLAATPEERAALAGEYRFGGGPRDVLSVADQRNALWIARAGATPRGLTMVGTRAFSPAGAPAVRIVFASGTPSPSLTVTDGPRVAVARRT